MLNFKKVIYYYLDLQVQEKLYLAQTLAKFLNVPFAIADATTLN